MVFKGLPSRNFICLGAFREGRQGENSRPPEGSSAHAQPWRPGQQGFAANISSPILITRGGAASKSRETSWSFSIIAFSGSSPACSTCTEAKYSVNTPMLRVSVKDVCPCSSLPRTGRAIFGISLAMPRSAPNRDRVSSMAEISQNVPMPGAPLRIRLSPLFAVEAKGTSISGDVATRACPFCHYFLSTPASRYGQRLQLAREPICASVPAIALLASRSASRQ